MRTCRRCAEPFEAGGPRDRLCGACAALRGEPGRWERLEALEDALTALAARMGRLEAAMAPKAILGAILAEGDRQMREDMEAEEADRARETGLQAARDRLRPQEG